MRLICPNCDAQYEVPDEVMPPSGRDVQCSNCGQTWFQHHPDHPPTEDAPDEEPLPEPDDAPEDAVASPPPQPQKPSPQAPRPAAERKQLDPSVADILRQEAEAEQEARRRRQAETLESQPDLGLGGPDDDGEDERAHQAKTRMARLRGEDGRAAEAQAAAAAVGSRRDLLPDIEEINSTLRSGNDRRPSETAAQKDGYDAPPKKKRSGFAMGFTVVVLITVLLILIYAFAPRIAAMVPQADPYLSACVAWVNQTRLWLDQTLQSGLQWLDDMAMQSGS